MSITTAISFHQRVVGTVASSGTPSKRARGRRCAGEGCDVWVMGSKLRCPACAEARRVELRRARKVED